MKLFLSSVYCLVFSFSAYAQKTAEITWGSELEFRKNVEFNTVAGLTNEYIVVLSSSGEDPVNSIDVNLDLYLSATLEYDKGISLVQNKSDHNFEKIIVAHDNLFVFTSYFDRTLNLNILAVQEYDVEKNTLGEMVRIDEVASEFKDDQRPFLITVSPDKSLILIYHENPSKNGNKLFNLKVIRNDFNTLWEKEISLNYKDKMVNFRKILIDNNSNAYMLSSINPFGSSATAGLGNLVNIKNTLFIYRPNEEKLKEFEFSLSRNWIDEVDIGFDGQEKLIASAYFTYPNDYKIRGFVLFELITATGEVSARKIATLDKNQIRVIDESIGRLKEYSKMLVGTSGIYPSSGSHMSSTSTEFVFRNLMIRDNGIVFAVEAFRRDERCNESFSDQQMIVDCQKHFLYGDAMFFFLDRNGQVMRINQISKLQHSLNKLNPYYSYDIAAGDDVMFILFNDDKRNLEENGEFSEMPLTNMNKAGLSVRAFNYSGDKLEIQVPGSFDNEIPFFPGVIESLSGKDFLLYSQKEKFYKFGRLSVQ